MNEEGVRERKEGDKGEKEGGRQGGEGEMEEGGREKMNVMSQKQTRWDSESIR